MTDREFLTQAEACRALRVGKKKLQLLRREGALPFYRFGHRSVRIRRDDLRKFIARKAG